MSGPKQTSFADDLARFVGDMLKLADLQLQLLSVDLRQMRRGTRQSLFLILFSVALLLGALPVLMFGLAGVVHLHSELPIEYAWLVVGAIAALVGWVVLKVALIRLARAAVTLQRSQDEFQHNLKWMRGVLHRDQEWHNHTAAGDKSGFLKRPSF
jgi:MFS family permease